ncbi:oxygen-dependent coproporphyrinogen oxidase [Sporocytophaga myxococcoides]|uniref:oxygen-dependent coproporphyrinogen oxidase n=1 Tax=Sporocytophaga myxococcoides TaxID=153721 RepID=UPI00041AE84F|nr:oxygen-dependent coproporphyrinogen oxidase [Sporocytophaga myxococcoides]
MNRIEIENFFKGLQDRITKALEKCDGKASFEEDNWTRAEGGGGRSRVIQNGNVFAKGGVNFSAIWGPAPEKITKALQVNGNEFYATGVSIVIHPQSPMVPIIHMNVRYFEMNDGTWWFGGGIDLTPHYINSEDAVYFHNNLKEVCDRYHSSYYSQFKEWADNYFFIPHRNETRGIGGIFFDRLSEDREKGISKEDRFAFVQDVGNLFAPLYIEIVNRNKEKPYSEAEKKWQSLRRSRYVEFNLVYDKGTKFGLDTNGRTESILMSMPPSANWEYNYSAPEGSREAETTSLLRKGINWVNNK